VKISIVTPWYGETWHLIADYAAATAGADVIAVDNATPPATAVALAEAAAQHGWARLRNDENRGFAGGNNQGYAMALGDIVLFLNSDIAAPPQFLDAVAYDVQDGALYGPSLQQQLVYGRWLPYLEGWCIAATANTWRRLHVGYGPWDADAYSGPYWEDNDLCFRAMREGISLIQTSWPIRHLGGQSAGSLARWADAFEANRATFVGRVREALADPPPTSSTWQRYQQAQLTQSDIQHHLGLLLGRARGTVVELGTRTGVSTAALLAGVERHGGHVTSIDIDPLHHLYVGHPQWRFLQSSSIDPATPNAITTPIDCLLIDTLHTYEHVAAELELWEPRVTTGGSIMVHDTETVPGLRRAVAEHCAGRDDLRVTYILPCNGMALIEKV